MKTLLALLAAVMLGLSGCAVMQSLQPAELPSAKPISAKSPAELAQDAIDEANLLIISIERAARGQMNARIMTPEQYAALGQDLIKYTNQIDDVQDALDMGMPSAAQQADMLKSMLLTLHQQVAQRSRK